MPPLIVAVLLGAGAYAGYRTARHLWARATSDHHDASQAKVPPADPETAIGGKNLGTLELDPATGVYRPTPHA